MYDAKARAAKIDVGQTVVKILAQKGKHKVADRYVEIYTVIEQPSSSIPVLKLKGEEPGVVRTLHRNHFHPTANGERDKDVAVEDNMHWLDEGEMNGSLCRMESVSDS